MPPKYRWLNSSAYWPRRQNNAVICSQMAGRGSGARDTDVEMVVTEPGHDTLLGRGLEVVLEDVHVGEGRWLDAVSSP